MQKRFYSLHNNEEQLRMTSIPIADIFLMVICLLGIPLTGISRNGEDAQQQPLCDVGSIKKDPVFLKLSSHFRIRSGKILAEAPLS